MPSTSLDLRSSIQSRSIFEIAAMFVLKSTWNLQPRTVMKNEQYGLSSVQVPSSCSNMLLKRSAPSGSVTMHSMALRFSSAPGSSPAWRLASESGSIQWYSKRSSPAPAAISPASVSNS